MERKYIIDILESIAEEIGAEVVTSDLRPSLGQFIFSDGFRFNFYSDSLDINGIGTRALMRDKHSTKWHLNKHGFSTIPGEIFFKDSYAEQYAPGRNIAAARNYAAQIGYPLIIKPNSGSWGAGVHKVNNDSELDLVLEILTRKTPTFLIEKCVTGYEYRLMVLDGKVRMASYKEPLSVVGDGSSSVRELLEKKIQQLKTKGRDLKITDHDPRIIRKLREDGLMFTSILEKDQKVFLLANANLSTGGEMVDKSTSIHESVAHSAIAAAKSLGLSFTGIDIILQNPIDQPLGEYYIIEMAHAPGMKHYVTLGSEQMQRAKEIYSDVVQLIHDRLKRA